MTKKEFVKRPDMSTYVGITRAAAGVMVLLNILWLVSGLSSGTPFSGLITYFIPIALGVIIILKLSIIASGIMIAYMLLMLYIGIKVAGAQLGAVDIFFFAAAIAALSGCIMINNKWKEFQRSGNAASAIASGAANVNSIAANAAGAAPVTNFVNTANSANSANSGFAQPSQFISDIKPGDVWNGWTIETKLGEGTYGKVFRIAKTEFGHTYRSALKVMRIPQNPADFATVRETGMDDVSVRSYFLGLVKDIVSEFEIMSELRGHSNIVSYEDHSVVELKDGTGWMILIRMELLTPLVDVMKKQNLSVNDIIGLGIDMCTALELCERYKIIHRDVKPQNVFLSKQGTYKLGDFGVARQMDKTATEMSKKGTYVYMAPEVYRGLAYDATVDIYSLGVMMYRFLNNNRPPLMPPYPQPITHQDAERANMRRLSGEPLPPPANAGGPLAAIILKACAFNHADRYQTAKEMRQALEALRASYSAARTPEGRTPAGNYAAGAAGAFDKEMRDLYDENTI